MPVDADLYLDRICLTRHTGTETCQVCHVDSLAELLKRLRSGQFRPGQCPHWPPERVEAFQTALDAGELLPRIPALSVPQPAGIGPFDFNGPTANSPVLITGNSRLTHEVLLAVLSTTTAPMWMLSIDTLGNTVDMALVYKTFTAEAIAEAVGAADSKTHDFRGRLILPGLAEKLAREVSDLLGRPVEVGPICAAEIPLFFGSHWVR